MHNAKFFRSIENLQLLKLICKDNCYQTKKAWSFRFYGYLNNASGLLYIQACIIELQSNYEHWFVDFFCLILGSSPGRPGL